MFSKVHFWWSSPEHLITRYNGWFIRKSSVRCQVQGGNLNSSFVVEGMAIARRLDSQTPRKLVDGFESGLRIQWFFLRKSQGLPDFTMVTRLDSM